MQNFLIMIVCRELKNNNCELSSKLAKILFIHMKHVCRCYALLFSEKEHSFIIAFSHSNLVTWLK